MTISPKYFLTLAGLLFFAALLCCIRAGKASAAIEIYVDGKKFDSLADYRLAADQETARRKAVPGEPVPTGPVKKEPVGVPFIDQKGWKTIQLAVPDPADAASADAAQNEPSGQTAGGGHHVAGLDELIPEQGSDGSVPVRLVRSARELKQGLASVASDSKAPLLLITGNGRIRLMELTRKKTSDLPVDAGAAKDAE